MDRDLFVSVFFPRRCAACGTLLLRGAVCEPCFRTIAISRAPGIGHPFFWSTREGGGGAGGADGGAAGGADDGAAAPPGGAAARGADTAIRGMIPRFPYLAGAAASYGTPALAALIRALKFRGIRAAAEPVADILAAYALPFRPRLAGYAVVPVPLSRERLRTRGFNQSELVAASFARRLALPLAPGVLVRARHTRPQTETGDIAERMANVRGCFAAAGTPHAASGRRFILIDDVTTTGATLLEAARALARARAAHVIALAAAKA